LSLGASAACEQEIKTAKPKQKGNGNASQRRSGLGDIFILFLVK